MKTTFAMIAIAAIFSLSACGQSGKDVPANIKSAFSQKFPNASKVSWGKETKNEWEAEFKMDGKEYSANYNTDGEWMETEYEISINEIPAPVKSSIDKEFEGYKIEEAEISETANEKRFEFSLKKDKITIEAAFDTTGKVVSKEQVGKEKEDED